MEEDQIVTRLSRVLFFKTLNVVAAIMDAAAMTNNWILIDRSSSTASSPSAELVIEMAVAKVEKPSVILVIDSVSRYQNFWPNRNMNR